MLKRFAGIAAGTAIALGAFGTFLAVNWDYDNLVKDHPYVAYTNYSEQVRDFDYQRANYDARTEQGDNPVLVFGSSELGPERGTYYPAKFWTSSNYGMNIQACGKAYVTDLWDAVMIGAFAKDGINNNKVVISLSMPWFLSATHYGNEFQGRTFSPSALDAFLNNDELSDDLKDEVLTQLRSHKVMLGSNPLLQSVRSFDTVATAFESSVHLRYRTITQSSDSDSLDYGAYGSYNQKIPSSRFGEPQTPNWDEIQQLAQDEVKKKSTNNDMGVGDKWYENNYQGWLWYTSGWNVDPDNLLDKSEIEEFQLTLRTCKEAGLDVLVVLNPVNGMCWDQCPVKQEYRNAYYDTIRECCAAYDAQVADLSGYEDTKYFFRDSEHPSEYGWSIINQAIYEFYMGDGESE